ncbi:MAG: 23S rRNA (guanosine(2251)-2'-O)-methyltransferase RlmB [Candidatus Symbiobacter sp.]|nr:23S rRNA (guanosine(2251)-2'-O)-methyltransferase RlmB [Candidatus Symbiobacter sp.]
MSADSVSSPTDYWLFGLHAVKAALANPARKIRRLVWLDKTGNPPDFLAALRLDKALDKTLDKIPTEPVTLDKMEKILPRGAVHQNIAALVAALPHRGLDDMLAAMPQRATILVLDQITDPHNFGAILRSAAAFGVAGLVVTERHAPPLNGTVAKAASGALELVPIMRVVNLARALRQLREADFWRIGLAEGGQVPLDQLLRQPPPMARIALIVGAEGSGMRRLTSESCDVLAHLPTKADFSTLNVSNAAAIALYECARRFNVISG